MLEKKEVIDLLNECLKLEYAARIQYLTHSELIKGPNAEKIIERLQEIAGDELKHEEKLRNLICNYLEGIPNMNMAATHHAENLPDVLKINLKDERDAVDFYKKIYQKIAENKNDFPYNYEMLEHELRHIIIDEESHITELALLLG